MHIRIPAAAAALLSFAVPAHAQDAPLAADTVGAAAADTTPRTSLQKGAWSLSFAAPGYGGANGEFGAWEMVGARTNLGLTLAIAVSGYEAGPDDDETTQANTLIELGGHVRRYVMPPREATPFVLGSVGIGAKYERRAADNYEETLRGVTASVRAAVGVEWFPVRRISLSGQTGFGLSAGRYDNELDLPDGTHRDMDSSNLTFQSFTSALSLQIYF